MLIKNKIELYRTTLFILLFFAVWIVRVLLYPMLDLNLTKEVSKVFLSNLFRFSLCIVPVFCYIILIDKKPPLAFLKLNTFPESTFYWSFFVILLGAGYQSLLYYLGWDVIANDDISGIGTAVFVTPIVEEITFRGFILTKLKQSIKSFHAILITSVLFMFIHWPAWILLTRSNFSLNLFSIHSLAILILGLFTGLVMHKSKSLYPCILLHSINNFIATV